MNDSQLMTKKLITVRPLDSVEGAIKLLRRRGVRHLLVMNRTRLVGIISDRDIKRALDPTKTKKRLMAIGGLYFLLEPILVEEIMTPDPITIGPGASAQDAARMMVAYRFGALPVIDRGKVVGVITETDLLRHFASSEEKPLRAKLAKKKTRPKKKRPAG